VPEKFREKRRAEQARDARKQGAHEEPGSQSLPDPRTARFLRETLLAWYAGARRDLPWRRTRDPYAIWLSEVMLQQTRVDTVVPYFERFLARWPTVDSLAEAPLDDVLAAWSGLGYYRRARMLHAGARAIAVASGFPADAEGLAKVPGIGRYTAGAVASIAYGQAAPLVDGNVARVFARLFAIDEDLRSTPAVKRLWSLASTLVDPRDPGSWNQALMELGATVCTPREPRCSACPVSGACRARDLGLEGTLPRMKAKAQPRLQRRWALVLTTRDDQVLLGQRHLDARFGGLWEPPMLDVASGDETPEEAAARLAALAGAEVRGVARAGDVTHVLSHRRLEVGVLRARARMATLAAPRAGAGERQDGRGEYATFAFVDPARLSDRGISTLARKVLALAIG
jgi:A/G-specific adenine glycosylase